MTSLENRVDIRHLLRLADRYKASTGHHSVLQLQQQATLGLFSLSILAINLMVVNGYA